MPSERKGRDHRSTCSLGGPYGARVDAFAGFYVTAPTLDDVKAWTPTALDEHIDLLQREHAPVITATGVEFVVDEPP